MKQTRKSRAFGTHYESEKQLLLFETPFEQALNPDNRWAVLARLIPWDEICAPLFKIFGGNGGAGRPSINPRVVIGLLVIKHLNDLDDRETVEQIAENPYMQYFLGYLRRDIEHINNLLGKYQELEIKFPYGFYPRELLADQIYCTRANRAMLKIKGISLRDKPLGRPAAGSIPVSPGERNPVEGKFGQGKTAYGLSRIRSRLKETSESWVASIFLVLNLVKLAGAAPPCLFEKVVRILTAYLVVIVEKPFFNSTRVACL